MSTIAPARPVAATPEPDPYTRACRECGDSHRVFACPRCGACDYAGDIRPCWNCGNHDPEGV